MPFRHKLAGHLTNHLHSLFPLLDLPLPFSPLLLELVLTDLFCLGLDLLEDLIGLIIIVQPASHLQILRCLIPVAQ